LNKQVRKIGIAAASGSGQPYYPIYELAPYRLACVAGGSFVAFIWTIFPYPLSDRSWIRKDLGSTLYLLANYYSVVHSTIGARMHDTEGNMEHKGSPGRQLEKVRHKIFGKLMMLLPSLQQHADWQKWEPTVGGKFPRETYEAITLRSTNIMNYLSLMSYATQSVSINLLCPTMSTSRYTPSFTRDMLKPARSTQFHIPESLNANQIFMKWIGSPDAKNVVLNFHGTSPIPPLFTPYPNPNYPPSAHILHFSMEWVID
jgi:hypothetical protein